MRKFYKVLLIAVIITAIAAGFSVKNFANASIPYDTKTLSQELSDALQNWIISNYSQYYKNIGVDLSLEPDSVTVRNGVASAVFDAKIDLTLKAERIEDLPFMKGMLNYLNSKRAVASKAQIEAANNLIDDWKLELKDYIGKPEPTTYAEFKIAANLKNDGTVEKDSIKLYVSGESSDFYPVPSPILETPEKMERNGEEAMEETFKKVSGSPSVEIGYEAKYTYNRLDARDYANSWTSNASYNGNCYMDASKWNNDEYPYYDNAYCNDCADYVSQALHEGGIPIDPGQWERLKDEYGDYTWAWTSVFSLKDYMYNNGHWTTSNFTNANAGCVIRMPEYDYHAVMIVLNDTIHRQFSGHTNDRKQYPYYSSNGWEYYTVQ